MSLPVCERCGRSFVPLGGVRRVWCSRCADAPREYGRPLPRCRTLPPTWVEIVRWTRDDTPYEEGVYALVEVFQPVYQCTLCGRVCALQHLAYQCRDRGHPDTIEQVYYSRVPYPYQSEPIARHTYRPLHRGDWPDIP